MDVSFAKMRIPATNRPMVEMAAHKEGAVSAGLLIIRLGLGTIMLAHGLQKVGVLPGGAGSLQAQVQAFSSMGFPEYLTYLNVAAELLGGLGLILGLLGRLSAFGVAVSMAVAIMKVHWQFGFFNQKGGPTGIEWPLALLAMAMGLLLTGMGEYSLDSALAKRMDKRIGGTKP